MNLLDIAQLRALENQMTQQCGPGVLMARAGAAAAAWVQARWPDRSMRILVLCGPGNNGGDGFACASALARAGYAPTVVALGPSSSTDARNARAQWMALPNATVLNALPALEGYALIVDALFGVGLNRALAGVFLLAAQSINATQAHVLALDCPSGLDAERGAWVGGVTGVHAHTTLTFIAAKPGLYTGTAVDACGEVIVDTLDVADSIPTLGRLNQTQEFPLLCQTRRRDTHKGSFGSVAVVGGHRGMVGAALLAARAALRLGAGRVYVHALGAADMQVDLLQPELMFRTLEALPKVEAVVLGCGLGQDAAACRAFDQVLLQHRQALFVLDADALGFLNTSAPLGYRAILTPHPLEAARLLQCSTAQVQADRIGAARQLATQTQSVVVLKGAGTVIATEQNYWINPTGGPALASAGSGDVLAGMIGALAAQSLSEEVTGAQAALAGTWLHGAAADAHNSDIGLVASDIATLAAKAWAALRRP